MIDSVIDLNSSDSTIKWRMTQVCNYKCSYCVHWGKAVKDNIKEDERFCNIAIEGINKLCNQLPGTVKIDMLGGEVTLMDLPSIISQLTSPKLKYVNITTNFSRSLSYFTQLIDVCRDHNIELSLTASYHEEYADLDTFMQKARELSDMGIMFKVEMVSTLQNQNLVKQFKQLCELYNIAYLIDRDVRYRECNTMVGCSETRPVRYVVTRDDGTIEQYKARSEFVSGKDNTSDEWGACIPTIGMYCTRDCDYVYIERHVVHGRSERAPEAGCRSRMSLAAYKLRKEPQVCNNPKGCSLCGHTSIARDKQVLIDLLEAKKEAYDDSKR